MVSVNKETEVKRDWASADLGKYLFYRRYTTTDNSAAEVININCDENLVYDAEFKVIVRDAQCSVYGIYHGRAGFYRAEVGNISQIDDTYYDLKYESNTSLDFDVAVDATNQTIDFSVTGLTGTVLYWSIEVEVMVG